MAATEKGKGTPSSDGGLDDEVFDCIPGSHGVRRRGIGRTRRWLSRGSATGSKHEPVADAERHGATYADSSTDAVGAAGTGAIGHPDNVDPGSFTRSLVAWHGAHRRDLPWRTQRSPYRVLVSEFMLQQTQVERVVPIFVRFFALFPTIEKLAGAPLGEVIRAWRGLGYNSRAVRLHAVARALCSRHAGAVPRDLPALLALPGIGPYTARAIRAFAFDEDEVALDTNVRRVLARVFHAAEPGEAVGKALAGTAEALLGRGSAYELNSAMMDLGATVCAARAPKCELCPLYEICAARNIRPWLRSSPRRERNAERFEESSRYLRGRIVDALRGLPAHQRISLLDLHSALADVAPARTPDEVSAASTALARDGVIVFDGNYLALPMNLTEV